MKNIFYFILRETYIIIMHHDDTFIIIMHHDDTFIALTQMLNERQNKKNAGFIHLSIAS